ncbi:MAG: hypothetical protein AB7E47_05075 [Desulfovibrionaceae bacterium]
MNIRQHIEAIFAAVAFAEQGDFDTAQRIAQGKVAGRAQTTRKQSQDNRARVRV